MKEEAMQLWKVCAMPALPVENGKRMENKEMSSKIFWEPNSPFIMPVPPKDHLDDGCTRRKSSTHSNSYDK